MLEFDLCPPKAYTYSSTHIGTVYNVQQVYNKARWYSVVEEWYGVWEGYMCESVSSQCVKTVHVSFVYPSVFPPFPQCVKSSPAESYMTRGTMPPSLHPHYYSPPALMQRVPFPRTLPPPGRSAGW